MIPKILLFICLWIVAFPISVYGIEGTSTVDVEGNTVEIMYDATGVEIISIEADLDQIELIFEVKVTATPAVLEITFEREFFDAKFGEIDDEFFAIADGDFLDIEETETTSESRTLKFELPEGTEEVEIFGTVLSGATFEEPEIEEPPMPEPEVEEPMVEEPEVEEPEMEKPPVEEPVEEQPSVCGPGTVLRDGECVLEQTCGPGTHLVDGVCVLDEEKPRTQTERPPMNQLIIGAAAALVISLIVILILWIISRGSRERPDN